jgi:electron transfer flavoprotein alpha subunit
MYATRRCVRLIDSITRLNQLTNLLQLVLNYDRLGLTSLLLRTSPSLSHSLAEPLAPMLAALIKSGGYTHLAAAHTALGKNIFPRVAGLLEVQQVSLISILVQRCQVEGDD